MNCIYQRNPGSGFRRSHSIFCLYCESDAVVHFNVGHACGNVCEPCARKRFKLVEVEAGIYVEEVSDFERVSS